MTPSVVRTITSKAQEPHVIPGYERTPECALDKDGAEHGYGSFVASIDPSVSCSRTAAAFMGPSEGLAALEDTVARYLPLMAKNSSDALASDLDLYIDSSVDLDHCSMP